MAININAKTSGVGGLETTADNSGNINIQSGGSTVMSVTSSGVAVTGSFSQNGAFYSTQPSFRNLIINGDMNIAQRGTSVTSQTAGGYFTVDRWEMVISTAGTWTMTQDTDVPSGQGFGSSVKLDCTTANASLSSNSQMRMVQHIEAQNLQHLSFGTSDAKKITGSFWIKSNKTGTYVVWVYRQDSGRQSSKQFTIDSANTWEKKTLTFDGDTTGTIANDNGRGMEFNIVFCGGTDFTSGTYLNGTWEDLNNANRYVGQVNLADSTSNYINITGIQLEVGSTATDFENLPYDVELARCQRYYAKTYNDGVNPGTASSLGAAFHVMDATMTYGSLQWSLPVKMRATPTTVSYSPNTGASGKFYTNSGPGDINSQVSGWNGMSIVSFNVANVSITATAYIVAHITASAEL